MQLFYNESTIVVGHIFKSKDVIVNLANRFHTVRCVTQKEELRG